ncbi:MAG TPA: ABC transporter ATP-binding protein, partial [Bacteroidales bacterium]|nr:ABC transporter ATP-binding protein [Bacteroidales bacterium]
KFISLLGDEPEKESKLAETMHSVGKENDVVIEARNLTKKYGNFTAADNVSFSVKPGEIFGLLGPNGAGKSTIFRMMCGLLRPTSGHAMVTGLNLETASGIARAKIGYMAQKFSLYRDLSVMQNLKFFSGAYGLKGNEQKERIDKIISVFDFEKYLNMNAGGLPLGYKQRLALGCAVMHEPAVLFLDEPTSGVDPIMRREFWTHINGMVKKGITIMVTTHFMEEAENCDRISLIYKAQSIAMGTPDELKSMVRTEEIPNPTMEDTFIELVMRNEKTGSAN